MTRLKERDFYHLLFQWGIFFLPIIEIYRSFWGDTVQVGPFALEEFLILLWAGVLFLAGLFFAGKAKEKKVLWMVGIYLAVFFLYVILHAWNASRFDASILPAAAPSFAVECYYTVRMYLVPICLIAAARLLHLPFEALLKSLRGVVWVIAISVVLTDLLGISFASYHDGNVRVDGGFFRWFGLSDQANFAMYTAKGPFSSANDMGSILFALTPFVTMDAFRRGKVKDLVLLFLAGLSAIMVGTKIGALGFFLSFGAVLFLVLVQALRERRLRLSLRQLLLPLLVVAVLFPLYRISPGYRLQASRDSGDELSDRPVENIGEVMDITENSGDELSEEELDKLEVYLEQHHWDHFVDPWFLEIYPVRNDVEFWSEVILRPGHLNNDSRNFKVFLADRITERNGGELDTLLGIGHTAGLPYAEKDYAFQYYVFGILGLLVLFFPFFWCAGENAVLLLLRLKRGKCLLRRGTALVSLGAFLVTAWLAGHVFDTILCMYFLAFSAGAYLTLSGERDE